jgi:rhamnosyl/mannosyltransferase
MNVETKDRQDRQAAQSSRFSRRLRVCHLGKFYHPAQGGMETHVRTLGQAQVELGADVRVVCVNHQDQRGRDVTWSRFAATATEENWDGSVGLTRVGRSASLARFEICLGLTRMLRRLQCDLFHLHVPNPTMLLALAASRPAAPFVVTYHSDVSIWSSVGPPAS